jgi:hypothetical protein
MKPVESSEGNGVDEQKSNNRRMWWTIAVVACVVFAVIGACANTISSVPGISGSSGAYFETQCTDIDGDDPSATETTTETTTPDTETPTDTPTDNPFVGMTTDPSFDAYTNDCIVDMNSGVPPQNPPMQVANDTVTATCAAALARRQEHATVVDGAGDLSGPTDGGFGPAQFIQYVIAGASYARVTGRCEPLAQTTAPVTQESTTYEENLNDIRTMVLPDTIAAQVGYGQVVAQSSISAGDLVFWDYSDYKPTRVGVALSQTTMIAPSGDEFTLQSPLPTGKNVVYKRVLAWSSQ